MNNSIVGRRSLFPLSQEHTRLLEREKPLVPKRISRQYSTISMTKAIDFASDKESLTVTSDVISSVVKLEKEYRRNNILTIQRMRKQLPILNQEDIRLLRLPLYEALVINLQEGGFGISSEYIKALFEFEAKERESGALSTDSPQLKFSNNKLKLIAETLKKAETFHNGGRYDMECEQFFRLGAHFAFGTADWWWLGQHILNQAIQLSLSYSNKIGHKCEAICRYLYATFLLYNLLDYENASKELNIARFLSKNKLWSSKLIFENAKDTLFIQVNQKLSDCFTKKAERAMSLDISQALLLAEQARKMAVEGCYKNGESTALAIKGECAMMEHNPKLAIKCFQNALLIEEKFGTIEGRCRLRVQLSKAFLMDNCDKLSFQCLLELKDEAEKHNLPVYLGKAYECLGKYYLIISQPDKATKFLNNAIKIFKACGEPVSNAVNLRAIATGLIMFPLFVELMVGIGTGRPTNDNLTTLLKWKTEKIRFWERTRTSDGDIF